MRRRWTIIIVVVLAIAVGGGVAVMQLRATPTGATSANTSLPTAEVVRTDMVARTQVDGTLSYAGSYTVTADSRGLITGLPEVGEVIKRGETVFDVDGRHVPLFYGSSPLWRSLSVGVANGGDIKMLKRNLKKLGYGEKMKIDKFFDWRLRIAVKEWQKDMGAAKTGVVAPGDVVVLPDPIRVTELKASPGMPASGVILTATGTDRQVEVPIPVDKQHLIKKKDKVTIRLPGEVETTGHVTSVGSVAVADSAEQTGEGTETATVTVTVRLDKPDDAGRLDGAPVTVGFAGITHKDVLAVPVAALQAIPGGGYQVTVVEAGGGLREVPVTLGLFSDGNVEVTGDLQEGTRVQVPRI